MKKQQNIQVISRAIGILRVLGHEGISLGEVARLTGLPRSTVQRIVDTLATDNLVEAGECGVRLGWGINELAKRNYSSVAARLRYPLEILFELTRETVDIATHHGHEVIFLDRIICDQAVRVVPLHDRPRPLYATANGKAMLSMMADEEIKGLLRAGMAPMTEHTIVSPQKLLRQINEVRKTGFAFDLEEHAEGVCGVSIALPIPQQPPHALSVMLPSYRFKTRLAVMQEALKQVRQECMKIFSA